MKRRRRRKRRKENTGFTRDGQRREEKKSESTRKEGQIKLRREREREAANVIAKDSSHLALQMIIFSTL